MAALKVFCLLLLAAASRKVGAEGGSIADSGISYCWPVTDEETLRPEWDSEPVTETWSFQNYFIKVERYHSLNTTAPRDETPVIDQYKDFQTRALRDLQLEERLWQTYIETNNKLLGNLNSQSEDQKIKARDITNLKGEVKKLSEELDALNKAANAIREQVGQRIQYKTNFELVRRTV